jgi:hypothetical protein
MYEIRVLLTVEHSTWVAQCLEYDIAAHGTTIAKAREALGRAFTAQVALAVHHGEEPLATLKPAPKPYWDLFEQGERLVVNPVPIQMPAPSAPPAFMIEAIGISA